MIDNPVQILLPSAKNLYWQELLFHSAVTADQLADFSSADMDAISRVIRVYPMRINRYFMSLIKKKEDPIWLQAVPDIRELENDPGADPDPLWEEAQSPVPHLIHRYPDRVLFLISDQCALYCRHCMRKRRVGHHSGITRQTIAQGIHYIQSEPEIREVILSGGDPFLLADRQIEEILGRLKGIRHVEILRIHTRIPCTFPQRITDRLANLLKRFHPLYINIQFNHPDEITAEATAACEKLADAGIPLGSQTVLLKGVNDDADVMTKLMRNLLNIRVKPYYLHHGDPVRGTEHFRTSIDKGLDIMKKLQGRISGMGIPHYMVDLPKGGGKVPFLPDYISKKDSGLIVVKNYEDKEYNYPLCGLI